MCLFALKLGHALLDAGETMWFGTDFYLVTLDFVLVLHVSYCFLRSRLPINHTVGK